MSCSIRCIVESRFLTRPDGKPETLQQNFARVVEALEHLHQNAIDGHKIIDARYDDMWYQTKRPCIVPDFGHKGYCKCEHPEPNGVLRLFGLQIVVEGYPGDSIVATYAYNEDIHIIVCS